MAASGIFQGAFAKSYIGDGGLTEMKPEILPFATRENQSSMPRQTFASNIRSRMGSPSQQVQPLSLTSQFLLAANQKQPSTAGSS